MPDIDGGKGRSRDANRTREAILDAAESVFAESGFAGARLEAIAVGSSYNKSLIGQYFGDKLGLYAEVLRRTDLGIDCLLAQVLEPWIIEKSASLDARQFKTYLQAMIGSTFDYLFEHPRLVRILTWEMASGWRVFATISSRFPNENLRQFEAFFDKAWKAGLLRSNFLPSIQFSMLIQICQVYLSFFPIYKLLIPSADLSSSVLVAQTRQYLIDFIVSGMMNDTE
jgi:TetR/AcrR family transcriptional regulator